MWDVLLQTLIAAAIAVIPALTAVAVLWLRQESVRLESKQHAVEAREAAVTAREAAVQTLQIAQKITGTKPPPATDEYPIPPPKGA